MAPEGVGPAARFRRERLEEFIATGGVFLRFLFAHDRFAEEVDGEADVLGPALPQRFDHVASVPAGDELARHPADVLAQDKGAQPRHDFGRAHAGLHDRREAVLHVGKIFVQMLDDVAGTAERGEDVDKAEHLHLEMLVLHGERHHPLVKAGLAENRLRVAVDQVENLFAAPLHLRLQMTHDR